MLKFLFALFLLSVPFSQGAPSLDDNAPTPLLITKHLKSHRLLEKEILSNFTELGSASLPLTLTDDEEITPLVVSVNTYVRDIGKIEKIDQGLYHWNVELTFRQTWTDKRLAYDVSEHPEYKYIFLNTPSSQRSIWKPDTFFSNSVKGDFHYISSPNSLIWVYPNGKVLYSLRLTLTLRCHNPQEVKPKDENDDTTDELVCPMRIASYGYTTDKLVYNWKKTDPIQYTKDLFIPRYTLKDVTTDHADAKTAIGSWSALVANFKFTPNKESL